jgi:hypothetical protein
MLMGRITESFRTRFQKQIQLLKKYQNALLDSSRRTAFHNLLKAWSSEQGAMSYAAIPLALDIMMITAAIDNRKLIQELEGQITWTTSKLKQIQQLLEKKLFLSANQ